MNLANVVTESTFCPTTNTYVWAISNLCLKSKGAGSEWTDKTIEKEE